MRLILLLVLPTVLLALAPAAGAQPPIVLEAQIVGEIDKTQFRFTATYKITTTRADQQITLIEGDVALDQPVETTDGRKIRYNPETRSYTAIFSRAGNHQLSLRFAARAQSDANNPSWRDVRFTLPSAQLRPIKISSDRNDLEIELPGAVRIERLIDNSRLTLTALQGAQREFHLRWKPQVQELDAKLVVSSRSNVIADIRVGALRLDTLTVFDVAQGQLNELRFAASPSLNITQVRGAFIRDWRLDTLEDGGRELVVALNRPQTRRYALQVLAEMPLSALPTEVDLPEIESTVGMRAGGNLTIGTNSAIQMVVEQAAGLAQIDAAAMPRAQLDARHPRPLPTGKAFYYSFAGVGYRVRLALDNIVPAYDAVQRHVLIVSEEDLTLETQIELDVRDAPIRDATIIVPDGFTMVEATGAGVTDYRVLTAREGAPGTPVRVQFQQPLLGRGLVTLKMEQGRSPLDESRRIQAPRVEGALNQRGYLVVVVENGLQVDPPETNNLRTISAASAPTRIPDAQFAYRFRDPDWSITLRTTQTPAGIRMEAFHLLSLGEGVAYGSVAANYFITGSPVDELRFVIAPELDNIQFVGRDVRRWRQDPNDPTRWIVTLQRKVIGDYNLGVTYTQRYDSEQPLVLIGGVEGEGVETQIGFVGIASHLNLKLTSDIKPDAGLLVIDREEMPANYRLLINAPLLQTYKYVAAPHTGRVRIDPYERGVLTPVVIELMQAETNIVPRDNAAVESLTKVRYKVKNSSQQFLTLSIPVGADVWATRLIERTPEGNESTRRITASLDRATGRLMVPLQRQRDPNEPITIELEYGQVHDRLGWPGRASFIAPISDVPSTFDSWTLHVPEGWSIQAIGGSMKPDVPAAERVGIAPVFGVIGNAWAQALESLTRLPMAIALIAIAACLLIGVYILRRGWFRQVFVLVVLVAALCIGGMAATTSAFKTGLQNTGDFTAVRYTQVIDLATDTPLAVTTRIVPDWRRHVTFFSAVIVPIASLLCLLASFGWRRWRPVLLAAALTGLAYAACRFMLGAWLLGHLLTWGVPLLLLIALAWRLAVQRRAAHGPAGGAVATATLVLALGLPGCTTTTKTELNEEAIVLRDLQLEFTAEDDNLTGEMTFTVDAAEPIRFDLLPADAILLDTCVNHQALRLRHSDSGYHVAIAQPGRYDATVRFLLPLPLADDNQVRGFNLSLPPAMTKQVRLTIPRTDVEVRIPAALRKQIETNDEGATLIDAGLGPLDHLAVDWKPRARQRELEQTKFFTTILSAVRFDAGLVEARHDLRFEVAQGQLDEIRVTVPDNMTVTAVAGQNVGAWRFDPATHALEVKLSQPAAGEYRLAVVTQIEPPADSRPVAVQSLHVTDTARQRATLGLTVSDAVDITVDQHPPAINASDFTREATGLLQSFSAATLREVRFAYRLDRPDDRVVVNVLDVQPEIRSHESVTFTVADDRLVYVGQFNVQIAKAGVFSFQLEIPEGYDIDTLSAEGMSHWDERIEAGQRIATVHLPNKRLGPTPVHLALSRPISGLPPELDAPRVSVTDALKHSGRIIISADRGVRLTVVERQGVSELNPTDLGIREQGTLAFSLLRPAWSLALNTEVIEPRITVESLHVATVSEGLVRHTHNLRYNLRHAGIKQLEITIEPDALGLLITGPNIARREEIEPGGGRWRIELTGKWYDRPYPLTVRYETRFDRNDQRVELLPVIANDADLQSCYVVAKSNDRVELTAEQLSPSLQIAEARTIPRSFAAGNLSDAALAYRAASPDYALVLRAQRLDAAQLLDAEVLSAEITSVVTERGETINRVQMAMSVGAKRNLETRLPPGAEVWSLLVNGRSATPAIRRDRTGNPEVYLVPLSQSASGELPVNIDMVYIIPSGPTRQWTSPAFQGPRFDLPLQNLSWVFYLPEGYRYDNFDGTLAVKPRDTARPVITEYDAATYEQAVRRYQRSNLGKAAAFQAKGNQFAGRGDLRAAKQALENAYNYSLGDEAFNEDARVQLHRLNRDQALLGLVESRGRLRQLAGPTPDPDMVRQQALPPIDAGFDAAQADRIRTSLSQSDSENLDLIISQLIETQEAAAAASVPLVIAMPLRGHVIEFGRAIQVEPNADMTVTFDADPPGVAGVSPTAAWTAGLFLVLLLILSLAPRILERLKHSPSQTHAAQGASEPDDGFFDDDLDLPPGT